MAERRSAVIWSPEAVADIEHLWEYYAHAAGRGPADGILREIAKVIAVLDDFPFAGRARDEIRLGLRSLAATPQTVFYRLKDGRPENRASARWEARYRRDFCRRRGRLKPRPTHAANGVTIGRRDRFD